MTANHIYIADASSLLWFIKRQVHRIGSILYAPNSHMLALVLKYAIIGRIGAWYKLTYLELNQMHPNNMRHYQGYIVN